MLIGELARRGGCDAGTVRYYEREGLLPEPYRSASGYRRYTEAHLAVLNFVRHCRSLGMTLTEIKALQEFQRNPQAPCEGINELIDRHIARIKEQISGLSALERQLAALRECCGENISAGECGIMKTLLSGAGGKEE